MAGEKEKIAQFLQYDILLMGGIPASGKTYLAKKFFFKEDRKRVSRLEIRKGLYRMFTFDAAWSQDKYEHIDEPLVKFVEMKILETLLDKGQKVLIDNTSVTRTSRVRYVDLASRLEKKIGLVFINIPVQKCLERNRARDQTNQVPESVISKLFSSTQLPKKEEGFTDIMIVSNY